uniref:CHHC U11-48K-type domain-containing protein n=1 Tax=Branchiostoma floridae TaxID=7739 RepID=C3ZB12_BRAFL|eukprot:XP_002594038.1 hypothetical protein BRAFLDRAFT_68522 [Branchiostoma floridae]
MRQVDGIKLQRFRTSVQETGTLQQLQLLTTTKREYHNIPTSLVAVDYAKGMEICLFNAEENIQSITETADDIITEDAPAIAARRDQVHVISKCTFYHTTLVTIGQVWRSVQIPELICESLIGKTEDGMITSLMDALFTTSKMVQSSYKANEKVSLRQLDGNRMSAMRVMKLFAENLKKCNELPKSESEEHKSGIHALFCTAHYLLGLSHHASRGCTAGGTGHIHPLLDCTGPPLSRCQYAESHRKPEQDLEAHELVCPHIVRFGWKPTQWVVCPFDRCHVIRNDRIVDHIRKCQKGRPLSSNRFPVTLPGGCSTPVEMVDDGLYPASDDLAIPFSAKRTSVSTSSSFSKMTPGVAMRALSLSSWSVDRRLRSAWRRLNHRHHFLPSPASLDLGGSQRAFALLISIWWARAFITFTVTHVSVYRHVGLVIAEAANHQSRMLRHHFQYLDESSSSFCN